MDIRLGISEQGRSKLDLAKAKVFSWIFIVIQLFFIFLTKIATHIPIFKHYKGYWPLHEILRQYLGTHKTSFAKDQEAEENEKAVPDRQAIQVYLKGLKSQRSRGSELEEKDEDKDEDDDKEQEEEDEQEKDKEDEEVEQEEVEEKSVGAKKTPFEIVSACLSFVLYFSL